VYYPTDPSAFDSPRSFPSEKRLFHFNINDFFELVITALLNLVCVFGSFFSFLTPPLSDDSSPSRSPLLFQTFLTCCPFPSSNAAYLHDPPFPQSGFLLSVDLRRSIENKLRPFFTTPLIPSYELVPVKRSISPPPTYPFPPSPLLSNPWFPAVLLLERLIPIVRPFSRTVTLMQVLFPLVPSLVSLSPLLPPFTLVATQTSLDAMSYISPVEDRLFPFNLTLKISYSQLFPGRTCHPPLSFFFHNLSLSYVVVSLSFRRKLPWALLSFPSSEILLLFRRRCLLGLTSRA